MTNRELTNPSADEEKAEELSDRWGIEVEVKDSDSGSGSGRNYSTEELEDEIAVLEAKKEFFERKGWSRSLNKTESEIEELTEELNDREAPNPDTQEQIEELEDRISYFEEQGWDSMVEKKVEELEELRHGGDE